MSFAHIDRDTLGVDPELELACVQGKMREFVRWADSIGFDAVEPAFLAELKPYATQLGNLAEAQQPVLRNVGAASGDLNTLLERHPSDGYLFEGRRYDAGDKLGFLVATVEFALKREGLGPLFREYLKTLKL